MSNFISDPKADTLADELRAATVAYAAGNPVMTDAVFDAKEDILRQHSPSHAYFAEVGAPSGNGWGKVSHPIPMGSLDKAQTDEEFLEWANKVGSVRPMFLTEKMDGISLLLTYKGGELVRAETRGNGLVGQDITRNARIMQGVSSHVLYDGVLYIRGEVVCRKTYHALFFPDESNARNTAAGKSTAQSDWRRAQHLTFYAYNLTAEDPEHGAKSRSEEFETLKSWGFNVPGHRLVQLPREVLKRREDYITTLRGVIDYDIDGLVIEIDDKEARESLGHHNHRPKGAIAFKFPHDEKATILRGILWQVGNSGRVTPVAFFDPVDLAGASVRQASLYNVANVTRLALEIGQEVLAEGDEILVSRRNDVIPCVESVLNSDESDGGLLLTPTECPSCSTTLEMNGEYLICPNELECPAQVLGSLKRWVKKLDILHLGEAVLKAVVNAGMVKTIGDLYRVDPAKVRDLMMDGRRIGGSADRGWKNLNARKALPLDLFLGSLGIPLVGRKMTKLLVDAGFDDLTELANATEEEMAEVDGFGPGRAAAFRKGYDERRPLILDILAAGVTILEPATPTGSAWEGQAVCFSGVRDKEAMAQIEAEGGSIASGVSKNTTLLVLKDVASTSSKAQKARKLGIEIIDLPELRNRLGGGEWTH